MVGAGCGLLGHTPDVVAHRRLHDDAQPSARLWLVYSIIYLQRVMKSRRDDTSKAAAAAAEEFAAKAMQAAEEAIRRAEAQDEEEEDTGPAKCYAIFKAEGFGMLEAMSQVRPDTLKEAEPAV